MLSPPLTALICLLVVRWVPGVMSRPHDSTAALAALVNTRFLTYHQKELWMSNLVNKQASEVSDALAPVYYFDQPIDYSDPASGTFRQRYWTSLEYYKPGGPIFLTTPGESNAANQFSEDLTNVSIHGTLAQSNGGAIVLLEHRYYGESLPAGTKNYKNATTLKYNTIDQAIEDIVYFAENVKLPMPGGDSERIRPHRRPWVFTGGSYAGALVTWIMNRHPGVFWAGYSSSGVVQPIADFWEYFEPVRLHMAHNCSTDVQRFMAYFDELYDTHNTTGIEDLNNRLGFSPDGDSLPTVMLPILFWQSTQPSTVGSSLFYKFCDRIEVLDDGTIAGPDGWGIDHTIAGLRTWLFEDFSGSPDGPLEDPNVEARQSIPDDWYEELADIISWNWMVCNEVGWIQTGAPAGHPTLVPRQYNLARAEANCRDIHPDIFGDSTIEARVAPTALKYPGWDMKPVDRLFVVNGERDPWLGSTLSAPSQREKIKSTPLRPIRLGTGFHCTDMQMSEAAYDKSIDRIQKEAIATMKSTIFILSWFITSTEALPSFCMANLSPSPSLSFSLATPKRYGPRLGNIIFRRPGLSSSSEPSQAQLEIKTPGIFATTSRGVVPHLSRDHQRRTGAIRWVNVPFETFLEHNPPAPTLQPGANPLHTFLGFLPGMQVVSLSARDPYDGRDMPPNGKDHISVYSLRGVRKLSPNDWRSHVLACQPDVVFSLSDTPFTDPPYSQKRLTKSIERSATWLANLLHPIDSGIRLNVLVHMAGGTSIPARKAFADSLLEKLYGPEADAVKPFATLNEGVLGYTFDLKPLRQSLEAQDKKTAPSDNADLASRTEQIVPLLKASLASTPEGKVRLVNSAESPHEILKYISKVGIDLFDAHWAQRAADVGVALDFEFPVRQDVIESDRKKDVGNNLYDERYAFDFGTFASSFRGALPSSSSLSEDTRPICPCAACSPITPSTKIYHGADTPSFSLEPSTARSDAETAYRPPYTRAYIHHLLHTHEMSAHALLVMHNLEVLDAFFAGIRVVLSDTPEKWDEEVQRFEWTYDASMRVCVEARERWREIDLARGKGRLARERTKQEEMEGPADAPTMT
ncbi:unnamed protein product [Cyclocybe aegerita]|uniref:tRNA-guanine(15) transglycosylase-like domain-containing protein n=1 Tax=Cyclocybe aegerita TaxID=1973307 RepID=A0A8S0WJK2_CYCAE|nr:unnamed protein product [Cyclocybe aegerita]